jgi:hypothetical protein
MKLKHNQMTENKIKSLIKQLVQKIVASSAEKKQDEMNVVLRCQRKSKKRLARLSITELHLLIFAVSRRINDGP